MKNVGDNNEVSDWPLVSIITATFNAAHCLPMTIQSIREQSYGNIEWIVVDGASKDATVELIRQNEDVIDFWLSEPDTGIYDAWNKGLEHAHGEWICFLGADDRYCQNDALEKMARLATGGHRNFVSGKMQIVLYNKKIIRGDPWNAERMLSHQVVIHPGALHHRSLFECHGRFDARYKIAGDYDFLLRASDSIRGGFLDEVVIDMGPEGASNRKLLPVFLETCRIQSQCSRIGKSKAAFNFMLSMFKAAIRRLA